MARFVLRKFYWRHLVAPMARLELRIFPKETIGCPYDQVCCPYGLTASGLGGLSMIAPMARLVLRIFRVETFGCPHG